jgi:hypothetical protein
MDCSLLAVDFMSADLKPPFFDNCDLYRLNLKKRLPKADSSYYNYTIDPARTKTSKAQFSIAGLKGLSSKT